MFLLFFSGLAFSAAGQASSPEPASVPAAPHVVATHPAQGSAVRSGPLTLRVTFDRPMLEGNYSFVRTSPETYPECETRPTLSEDRRTYALSCTVSAGRHYEVWFNRPPYLSFKSEEGVASEPYRLLFTVEAE